MAHNTPFVFRVELEKLCRRQCPYWNLANFLQHLSNQKRHIAICPVEQDSGKPENNESRPD
jgi:hypothetical protein